MACQGNKLSSFFININDQSNGYKALILSSLSFSLMSICVKNIAGRIPIVEIIFFRSLISLIITRLQLHNKRINPWGKNKKLLILRGVLGTSALFCVFKALGSLPIASATVIQYTYPTFTAIGAWLFLKEKNNINIWLAVVIGWIGICMVLQPSWGEDLVFKFSLNEILIALSGAILTSMAYLCIRKLSKTEENLVIIYYFPFISLLLTTPIILKDYISASGIDLIWLLATGIFTQSGQVLITKGLKLLTAGKASSISYIQVLFSSILGFIFFNEGIDPLTALGSLFILSATLISIKSNN